MKEKGKNLFILVLLVGVIAIVASFYAVYKPNVAKAKNLQGEIDTVRVRVEALTKHKDNEKKYKADIEKYLGEVETVLAEYPADVKYEDALIDAINMQKDTEEFKYLTITVEDKEEVLVVSDETVMNMDRPEYVSGVGFNLTEALFAGEVGYPDLKKAVKYALDKDARVGVCNISYQKAGQWLHYLKPEGSDEFVLYKANPLLAGVLVLDYYSVSGTDKVYEYPDMSEYEALGGGNIFGTIELTVDEETGEIIVADDENN